MLNRGEYPKIIPIETCYQDKPLDVFQPCLVHLADGMRTLLERHQGTQPVFMGKDVHVISVVLSEDPKHGPVKTLVKSAHPITWNDVFTRYRTYLQDQRSRHALPHEKLTTIMSSHGCIGPDDTDIPELLFWTKPHFNLHQKCSCHLHPLTLADDAT
jgi:hypothetical protein